MSDRSPLPRSHPGRPVPRYTRPLPKLAQARLDVEEFSRINPKWQPVLRLYDELCVQYGDDLFGSAIMGGGLVLSVRSEVAHDEGVILVHFDPRKSHFSLSYRHSEVQPEQAEICSEEEVRERLRLYLAYKFGLHRAQKKEPNQSVEPTAPSGRGSP